VSEVRFYHLQRASLEDVLPVILERAHQRGTRTVVLVGSQERAQALNAYLWTFRPDSFLPHATVDEGRAETQPIVIATEGNPNRAELAILADGAAASDMTPFKTICEIFDGNDPTILEESRRRWRAYGQQGHTLIYYQQSPEGKWVEQARSGSQDDKE
jgi:DNA polymerase-3 subunit chi